MVGLRAVIKGNPQLILMFLSIIPALLWTLKVISSVQAALAVMMLTFISRQKAVEKQKRWERAEEQRRAENEQKLLELSHKQRRSLSGKGRAANKSD